MAEDKLDFMIKTITRTDSYMNYANTKSTILLTLATVFLGVITVNLKNIIDFKELMSNQGVFYIVVFFIVIFEVSTLISMFLSISAINPYIVKSDKENVYSFVDIVKSFNNESDYEYKLKNKSKDVIIDELISLNYNLSKSIISKYESQKKAIFYILIGVSSLVVSLCINYINVIFGISDLAINTLIAFLYYFLFINFLMQIILIFNKVK